MGKLYEDVIGEATRNGKRIRMEGWNGNGMFVIAFSSLSIGIDKGDCVDFDFDDERLGEEKFAHWCHYETVNTTEYGHVTAVEDTKHKLKDCLCLFTPKGEIQLGWVCSQADMFSDTWEVMDSNEN